MGPLFEHVRVVCEVGQRDDIQQHWIRVRQIVRVDEHVVHHECQLGPIVGGNVSGHKLAV